MLFRSVGASALEPGVRPARNVDALRIQHADEGPGLRWFIRRGATTWFNRGFRTKARASVWINDHGHSLDWRSGYCFRLRGDARDVEIVDRRGNVAYEALKAAVTATEQPWQERFRWLAAQHWIEPEATVRLGLQETHNAADYERQLIAAVDKRITA